jgi:hypothetical protein
VSYWKALLCAVLICLTFVGVLVGSSWLASAPGAVGDIIFGVLGVILVILVVNLIALALWDGEK